MRFKYKHSLGSYSSTGGLPYARVVREDDPVDADDNKQHCDKYDEEDARQYYEDEDGEF